MTDSEIIKALEICADEEKTCEGCVFHKDEFCGTDLEKAALDLIQRQQKKIDELTDREAVFSFNRIHRNIAELNLILEGYNVEKLKKRFRVEFEERLKLGVEDVNWADWLDSIADEMWEEVKGNDR